jgi:hypothetical protein
VALNAQTADTQAVSDRDWYDLSTDEVTAELGIDPVVGLPAAKAADLLRTSSAGR